jgi:diguanylate cyclase (GGDEF)-like protein
MQYPRPQLIILIAFLYAAVLAIDLMLPIGLVGGILYVAPVLVTFWFPMRLHSLLAAGLATVFVVIGFFFSPGDAASWEVLANRCLAILVIWMTASLVNQRKRSAEEMERLAEFTMENPNPALRVDYQGRVLYANPSARELFSWGNSKMDLPDVLKQGVKRVGDTRQSMQIEFQHKGRSYALLLTWLKASNYVNVYGQDITEQKAKEESLVIQTLTDSLTGISNRRRFDEVLQAEWSRALRSQTPISLLMIDIDFFKFYNDTYGHQAGDDILKKVAKILVGSVKRPGDLAARYGGEEFVVLLPGTDLQNAGVFAEALRQEVEDLHLEHRRSRICPWLTISVGYTSMIPEKEKDPEGLVQLADKALYMAKETGRNRVKAVGLEAA